MAHLKTYHPPGTAPGTLVESDASGRLTIRLIDYTMHELVERMLDDAQECKPYLARDSRTWIAVNGRPDPDTLRELGAQLGLHELALEDVINLGQRPKLEIDEDQVFLILSLPSYRDGVLELTQISLFAGEGYIVCFCPLEEDPFEPIRRRLGAPANRLRTRGADYLLYALVDFVVDAAFPVIEEISRRIEAIEDELLGRPDAGTLAEIHALRRDLLLLRRGLWPQRDAIGMLIREGT